ncbi:hypothetical protein ACVIGB_000094 [Bradyrhizobium sp. USDA 4341]
MKFQLKFQYPVQFKPARAIKTRAAYFPATGEIEIPEVPRSSVKTVFRVGTLPGARQNQDPPKWSFEDAFCAKPDGSLREIVLFDGALYVESVSVEAAAASLAADSLNKGLFAGLHLNIPHDSEAAGNARSRSELERRHPTPFRMYSDDGGEKVRQKLERRARSFMAIDDKIYVRCHEPVLYIDRKFGSAAVKFGKAARSFDGSDVAGYNGLVWDDARSHYYSLTESEFGRAELKRRHPDDEVQTIATFEIVDPTAVRATPYVDAVVTLAHQALKKLWEHPLSLLPDAIECAVALRDTLSESGDQVTPRLLRTLEVVASLPELSPQQTERWKQLAEVRPKRPEWSGERYPGNFEPSRAAMVVDHLELRTQAAEFARDALRRYQNRPTELGWEDRAFGLNMLRDTDGRISSVELLSQGKLFEIASRLNVDATGMLDEIARGGRVFAIREQGGYSTSEHALLVASLREDGLQVRYGTPEHRALVERHIAAALESEPHLAPAPTPILEMSP